MKVLVVAAHPDDEVLGVGGTILKHTKAGDEVFVCIVTKAYEPQWPKEYMEEKIKEQEQVDNLLGVKKRFNLDLPTVKLNTLSHGEINKKIAEVVDGVNPDIIYTHFEGDLNLDHTLIFRASMVASRPPKNIKLLCFETLSETEWNNQAFLPNYWVNIGGFIDKKVEALKIYKSEVKPYPHPRSEKGVRILAQKRGLEICREHAEAFALIREIREEKK
ncbi:MAG: PIG-L family deacetylase [Candidatus Saganbacteria bacterium]|nr:PIG-L family deacetylase [Candidatus Saganbacteria bacterium]